MRFAVVENDTRYQNWGLYVRLLEASRLYMRTEPAEAVDIVRLAIVVAEHLDPEVVGAKRVADLRAAAWADLGNVKRLASDFEGSRRAFNEAWRISEEGTGEPVEAAYILSSNPRNMRDMGEFETAEGRARRGSGAVWARRRQAPAGPHAPQDGGRDRSCQSRAGN